MPQYFDGENYIVTQQGPYADQLWLGGFGDVSLLNGRYGILYDNDRAFGVSLSGAPKAQTQKNAVEYTRKDFQEAIRKYQKETGLKGLEKRILANLK